MATITEIYVNGIRRAIHADAAMSLLSVLRDQLDLTGTKFGCGEDQCGACTVLIEGFPQQSCTTPVGTVAKKRVTTIESVAQDGHLHPLQQAFLDAQALQCGYCTPGMIMTALALLRAHPNPSAEEIANFMEGNICRCGTYPRIVAAIQQAAKAMRKSG